ncbi:hypothetical protein P4S64_16005 [Vibrio sp. M60_M31a]
MGFVKGGLDRMGEKVYYPQVDGTVIEALKSAALYFWIQRESAKMSDTTLIEQENKQPLADSNEPGSWWRNFR